MALVDQAAAVAAIRHAGGPAVTASIERVDFRERIPVGALVTCAATVDFVGNSSMYISVEVYSEWVSTGERRHTHTAHVVFVAVDEQGKPRRVPRLVAETKGAGAVRPGRGPPPADAPRDGSPHRGGAERWRCQDRGTSGRLPGSEGGRVRAGVVCRDVHGGGNRGGTGERGGER